MEKVLMCPPDYFDVVYSINPWMKGGVKPDKALAKKQWENLYDVYVNDLKIDVELIKPQPELPDMVFAANAGLVYNNKVVVAEFKHKERQREAHYYREWFKNNGYEIFDLPKNVSFEGSGDALLYQGKFFVGYGLRSSIESHKYISKNLGIEIIPFSLQDPKFYHVDVAFFPLKNSSLVYYPKAFDEEGNRLIEKIVPKNKLIAVTDEEADAFSCNAINLGDAVVINKTTDRLKQILKDQGLQVIELDLSEFKKAGGSVKCMTLILSY